MKKKLLFTTTIIALLATLICLKYLINPFIYIALIWFFVLICFTLITKKTSIRLIFFYLSIAILTIGIFEVHLVFKAKKVPRIEGGLRGHNNLHDILGYAPEKSVTLPCSCFYGDKMLYNVVYTIGPDGLRKSPFPKNDKIKNREETLFFGGSFVLGIGVNDDETLPYQVEKFSEGKYLTYNFATGGYGPHQMLALLENNMEKDFIKDTPKYAVYMALHAHIYRAAGRASWDWHGPRYVLTNDQEVKYTGHFDDIQITSSNNIVSSILEKFKKQLNKSLIIKQINNKREKKVTNYDMELFLGIIDKARNIFEDRYPGSKFFVILWDSDEKHCAPILQGLLNRNIRVHLVSKILPDFKNDKLKYTIDLHEYHPNPLAHKLIGKYIVENMF